MITWVDELRARIAHLDSKLLELVEERLAVAEQIGAAKREAGQPVRSFAAEAEVLARYRNTARVMRLDGTLAERLAHLMIGAAVRRQEEAPRSRPEPARRVLIVGGAGKMGRWLADFFIGQGHSVTTLDPAGPVEGCATATDLAAAVREAHVVLLATPLAEGGPLLREVLALEPEALIADIFSLKSHVLEDLRAGAARGLMVASLHPLFGPTARTLSGRVVAVCDCGNPQAADEAAALFGDTALTITRMTVDRHDAHMQYVLGLSHVLAILFFTTLARSGATWEELAAVASTTFLKEARTAAEVAQENPHLYYEIQHLNRHSPQLYSLITTSLSAIELAVLSDDPALFADLMERGKRWFTGAVPAELD
jgi:chorismate mutase/prephenate dehydrogenase